ncbi:hypothetical protein Hanom_Chr16g01425671 [Helianthus anomalus]
MIRFGQPHGRQFDFCWIQTLSRFDYWDGFRSDPARVPPELPHRNPVLPEEHQDYHRRMYSSNPQSESYYKSTSRFIDDNINDGYGSVLFLVTLIVMRLSGLL